jgi:hypothetical protein
MWARLRDLSDAESAALSLSVDSGRFRSPSPLGFTSRPHAANRLENLRRTLRDARLDACSSLIGGLRAPGSGIVVEPLAGICTDLALVWGGMALDWRTYHEQYLASVLNSASTAQDIALGSRVATWMFDSSVAARLPRSFDDAVSEALRCYAQGVDDAWGSCIRRPGRFEWRAGSALVRGHVLLAAALIEAWGAEVRDAGDSSPAQRPWQQVLQRDVRFGTGAATWVAVKADGLVYRAPQAATAAPGAPPDAKTSSKKSARTRGSSARTEAGATPAKPPTPAPIAPRHWIEIELFGEDDKPIPSEAYELKLASGRKIEGRLDAQGFARLDDLPDAGLCHVCFPRLDGDAWQPVRALPNRMPSPSAAGHAATPI